MIKVNQEDPVFLCGPLRSGSTVLHVMLAHNPNIDSLGEYDFLFDMVSDEGEIPSNCDYLEWLGQNRIFNSKGLEVDSNLNYFEQIRSFLDQKSVPGKKLVLNLHRNFHRVPFLFPEAKFIHLIRDPRDVARSCIGMGWVGNVFYGVNHWLETESSWDRMQRQPDRCNFTEVYFERLIQKPESNLHDLCEFIDVPFSNEMLCYEGKSTYNKPDPSLTMQWKRKLKQREIQNVEAKASEMILDRGYELSGYPLVYPGIIERVYLYIQNKSYKIQFRINRYGIGIYLAEILTRYLGLDKWHRDCVLQVNDIDKKHLR